MKNAGYAHMGVGAAKGTDKAQVAAMQAISSPLLETNITGATGVLVSITASEDIQLDEIDAASNMIYEEAHPDANIIWGAAFDPTLQDEMRVTVIATGFIADNADSRKPEPSKVVPAPSVDNIISQPTVAPVPSFEEQFKKVEAEPVAEPVKPVQPINNSSYESVYGGTFSCITKNKKR